LLSVSINKLFIPYLILLPKSWKILKQHFDDIKKLKKAAALNVQLYLLFSLLFSFAIGLIVIF